MIINAASRVWVGWLIRLGHPRQAARGRLNVRWRSLPAKEETHLPSSGGFIVIIYCFIALLLLRARVVKLKVG